MARRGFQRLSQRRGQGTGRLIGAVVLTAAVAVALTLLVTQPRGGQAGVAGLADDVGGAIGGVVGAPVRWAQGAGGWIGSFFGGAERVRALEADNAMLIQWRDQAKAMGARLDAYEQLHAVRSERLPEGITARMVAETSGPFSRAGIVNAGTAQGVKVNWVVFNQNGLVGRVISVGSGTARVLLLNDGDSRVPVMGETSRARGIVIGDKTAAPQLAHLNLPPVLGNNERLMTSGDDGLFPRGLAVGTAGQGPDGKWRVRLASARSPLDFVTLVPPSDFPPPAPAVTPPVVAPIGEAPLAGIDPATGTLPLAPGAASVPAAATPAAIATAQRDAEAARQARATAEQRARQLAKAEAERDAARTAQRQAEAEAERARRAAAARAAARQAPGAPEPEPDTQTPAATPVPVPVPVPLDATPPQEGGR
jgi:rod shape-determining protein MreC